MTIKDLDSQTLTTLEDLCDIWYVKACPDWLVHFMDGECQGCELHTLCFLLDSYADYIKKELDRRDL